MTKLEEYVITYADVSNKIICNLPDYYLRYVMPLDEKFTHFALDINRTAICPLHDDHDPSLGLIHDKHHKGALIYHCFGCGRTGNVVRFHQYIEKAYHNRELTIEECCYELCRLFGIPEPDLGSISDDDYESKYVAKLNKISRFGYTYSSRDFHNELLKIRRSGNVNLDSVNMACIKLIATKKGIYS